MTRDPGSAATHKNRVTRGAYTLTGSVVRFETFDIESLSHQLFVARPAPNRRSPYMDFASNRVREIVSRAYASHDEATRASFFKAIRVDPWFGLPAGKMYKVHVFLWFQYSQSSLQCTGAEPTFPKLSVPACPGEGNFMFFSKPQDLADILAGIKEHQTGNPICVVPTLGTFPSFDAFVITDVNLITIQVTISDKHDAKEVDFKILNSLPTGLLAKWRKRYHLFITDRESNAAELRKQNLPDIPNGTLVYSVHVPVERLESEAPVTEERVTELEQLRVSVYWFYLI